MVVGFCLQDIALGDNDNVPWWLMVEVKKKGRGSVAEDGVAWLRRRIRKRREGREMSD